MDKRKSTKGQTTIYKTYTSSKRSSNTNLKTGDEHRITAYESAQAIQTFVLQTKTTLARFADVGNEDLEAI